jgi:uncharacterized C2H2 Zn-finger protein
MVDYKCSQCGRVFDKKSNYTKHLRRVFSCKSETPNSPELIDLNNSPPNSPVSSCTQLTKALILSNKIEPQKTPTNTQTNKLKNKKHICPQCFKTFTRADNLNRHISTVCGNTPNKQNIMSLSLNDGSTIDDIYNDDDDTRTNLSMLGFTKIYILHHKKNKH